MPQNLVSLDLVDTQLQTIDRALADLEAQFSGLVGLTATQRRTLMKMGEKSEAFCRQTISMLAQNPHSVPASVDVLDAQSDLAALDHLRPRLQRLQRLSERVSDTEMALGSDVMVAALEGYALLKISGKHQGLEGLCKALGSRFSRPSRPTEPVAE